MKLLHALLPLIFFSQLTLAQNTEKLDWSNKFKIGKSEIYGKGSILMDTPSHLLGVVNGILIYKSFDTVYGIENGKIVYQHKTKTKYSDGEQILLFQNRLLYFSIKKRDLLLTEHNLDTGEPIGQPVQLIKDLSEKNFFIRSQKNEHFVMLIFHSGNLSLDEASPCFRYLTLNSELKVIHSNLVNNELKGSKKEGEHLPILIDDGRVLFFYKEKENGDYNFKIHSSDGIIDGRYKVPKGIYEDQELKNDPELFLLDNGDIKAYWTFMDSEKKFSSDESKRTFKTTSFTIDLNGNVTDENLSSPFATYPDSYKRDGLLDAQARGFELRQRKGYLLKSEGAYVGLAENELRISDMTSASALDNKLYLNEIFVYKLDSEDEILWSHIIRKRQAGMLNYGSFVSFISGNNLLILFNDHPSNYKNDIFSVPDDKLLSHPGIKKRVVAMVKINLNTGDCTRKNIHVIEDRSDFIAPTDYYETDSKVYILSGFPSGSKILSLEKN